MTLVAGIDSSTQSCKVSVRDLKTGREVRRGSARHPDQTILSPDHWWEALLKAIAQAGGLLDVSAISVSGQNHTPVFLGEGGEIVCDSPLWNDTSSYPHTEQLNRELGRDTWIERTGLPLTLSDTAAKLRWLRDVDSESARKTRGVAMVHDWLTWRLKGYGTRFEPGSLDALTTDRSDASGTAYWSGLTENYCLDLFEHAFGKKATLPKVLGPWEKNGRTGKGLPGIPPGIPLGVGSGDNAAAALALELSIGEAILSIGTSGVVYSKSARPIVDTNGYVCSYADATGLHLPLVATLNAARNLDVGARVLNCTHSELADLALRAVPGAEGLTVVPYFQGERTPDVPTASGSLIGATLNNFTRENFARSLFEGTLASQVGMLSMLKGAGIEFSSLKVIGGAAASPAVQAILAELVDLRIEIPAADEYVSKGAAMQSALVLTGELPAWPNETFEVPGQAAHPEVLEQYSAAQSRLGYL